MFPFELKAEVPTILLLIIAYISLRIEDRKSEKSTEFNKVFVYQGTANNVDKMFSISNQKGFTLIELISVFIILGVLFSVTIRNFGLLSDTASQSALLEAVKELNTRETLVWTKLKLSDSGWTSDADVFAEMDENLGADYAWKVGPNASGGTLSFRTESIALSRTASTASTFGRWK